MNELFKELHSLQDEVIKIVSSVSEKDYHQQFHPDLSPIGWHLGHCVYTELYWIREELLEQQTSDDSLKSLYVPELSHKPSRGAALPEKKVLIDWAKRIQSENNALLDIEVSKNNLHPLLKNIYLLHFLIQHYSQHIETMTMVLTEIQLQQPNFKINNTNQLAPKKSSPIIKTLNANTFEVGSNDKTLTYDNERPEHTVSLKSFKISTLPVSNSDYLQFINEDGYSNKIFWSDDGWQWNNSNQYKHPHHWRIDNNANYFGINHNGCYELISNDPVYGLSHYEAEAFARWSRARLPHEHEWEVASKNNCLQQSGIVWEWCRNTFYPYKNFSAYPYEGYSKPYFDDEHYVLRGGSMFSKERIKRSSFRNYYTADKRHIYAGLRLVFDYSLRTPRSLL
jgi:ergothioneine biosynthesis protein EgtB